MKTLIGALVLVAALAFGDDGDPSSRVARLNYLSGSVSLQPSGVDDWTPATLNYPLSTGDQIWIDNNARAEMHIGSTSIHIDSGTASSLLNLDDRTVQMRLSQGSISIRIRNLADDEVYEIDTPNGAISLLRTGSYRIDADPDRQTTTVAVHGGQAEVTAGASAFQVYARQSGILTGSDSPTREIRMAGPLDGFDQWAQDRDAREDSRPAPRYVSREMPGYEDLDANGSWQEDPEYGAIWAPRVAVDWAPYRYGHWRWIEPWGWTWIDDAPWGFAPFHYGRWAYRRNSWFWVPGPVVARPVYAPALVAFVGGAQWSASIAIGGGGGVGWFPLGPREVYRPAYRVSPAYINRVNVVNVTRVTNVTNVTNVTYVNQRIPGAVTVVSRNDFTTARPVSRVALRVPESVVASAQVAGTAPQVAPRRESMLAHRVEGRIARPPDAVVNRIVITKRTPPPPAVPFSARQSALEANPGQPVDSGTLSRLRQSAPVPRTQVRSVTPPALAEPQSTRIPNNPERPPETRREQLRQQQQERVQRPPEPQVAPGVSTQRPGPEAVPQERFPRERVRPERPQPERVQRPPEVQAVPPEARQEKAPQERIRPERVRPERPQPERVQPPEVQAVPPEARQERAPQERIRPERVRPERPQPERVQRPPEVQAAPPEARQERAPQERVRPERIQRPQAVAPEPRREEKPAAQEERPKKQGERREREKPKPE